MLVGVDVGGSGVGVERTIVVVAVGEIFNAGVMSKGGVIEQPETISISIPRIGVICFMADLNYTPDSLKSVGR